MSKGFTLIEVLIALAIISIALTAILKVTSQNIRDTHYVEQKSIAMWVGSDVMNKILVELLKPPEAPDQLTDKTDILGQTFAWHAERVPTLNPHIHQINVDVLKVNSENPILHLTGYLYVEK